MVEWEAANISPSSSSLQSDEEEHSVSSSDDNDDNSHSSHVNPTTAKSPSTKKSKSKRRRITTSKSRTLSETPEAAIARLTSAYNAAMMAVGALHKASDAIAKSRRSGGNRDREHGVEKGVGGDGGDSSKEKDATKSGSKDESGDVIMEEDNAKIGDGVKHGEDNNVPKGKEEQEMEKMDTSISTSTHTDEKMKEASASTLKENISPPPDPTPTSQSDSNTHKDAEKQASQNENQELESLKRVALAARHAFENALLSDPLIVNYAPILSRTRRMIQNKRDRHDNQHNHVHNITPSQSPISISKAHQITVKELAYLSLVNYADLILACCSRGMLRESSHDGVLDRGAVQTLRALHERSSTSTNSLSYSIWSDVEKEEDSKRLALVSYCDSVDLDGSDPTTWLKVACAARSLSRVIQERQIQQHLPLDSGVHPIQDNFSFNRLERYALECGLTTLRPGIPPNRAISRAFRELEEQMLVSQNSYITTSTLAYAMQNSKKDVFVIELPRYSWSTLGRSLLQAYKSIDVPTIRLKISPLLTLPTMILGKICEFLGLYNNDGNGDVSADVKRLEATCRALSVDIISARAFIEKDRNLRMKQIEHEMHQMMENENNKQEEKLNSESDMIPEYGDSPTKFIRANRTSKRVQSQLITSGKQAERSAKRKSVEYCLFSSIIPCTTDSPLYTHLVGECHWEKLGSFASITKIFNEMGMKDFSNVNTKSFSIKNTKVLVNGDTRTSKASLNDFISRWSELNTGALDLLYKFLAYISCHIEEVCQNEQGGAMVLTSCISECK